MALFFLTAGHNYAMGAGKDQIAIEQIKEKPIVTLYYAAYCPFSQEVLAYLRSIQKKIPMKDVKKDPQAKEELKNIGGVLEVPCLIIDGEEALYSAETIIQWLKEHKEELESF
jgi:glutaredoxin